MKSTHYILSIIVLLFSGCNLITDYKLDTNPDYLKEVSLIQYLEEGKESTLTMYLEAIKYAGLEEQISTGNRTRIIPTNDAIKSVLSSAGVEQINQLSKGVIRNLFSYLTFDGTYRSIDMETDQSVKGISDSGEPIFLTRKEGASDKFLLYVNDSKEIDGQSIAVIRQDYLFKDGVAHVVGQLPLYIKKVKETDPIPDDVDHSQAPTYNLPVTEDANVYHGAANTNYNGSNRLNYLCNRASRYRYTFFKFALSEVDFIDNLFFAKLCFNVKRIVGSFIPSCAVYATSNEWTEKTLTYNNRPEFGLEVSIFDLSTAWNETDITQYIQNAYNNSETEVSFGLKVLNGEAISTSQVEIYPRETSSTNLNNSPNAAYIKLQGAIDSELQLDHNQQIKGSAGSIITLTKVHLQMSAGPNAQYTYNDNNIIFIIEHLPANGRLVRNGLPMTKSARFTQAELAAGIVKYIHNGQGTTDTFILKVQDYTGGVYTERIPMQITIQ